MNDDPDPFSIERAGSDAGLNPMFGEWQQTFPFAPVPYGDSGEKRAALREAIQSQLKNKWIYSHEIHLEITPHLDVQTVIETSETADLDNYAKAILDGLKGPQGIMFDDTQVQSLAISWLDGCTSDRLKKNLALLISRLRARHLADVRPLLTPP